MPDLYRQTHPLAYFKMREWYYIFYEPPALASSWRRFFVRKHDPDFWHVCVAWPVTGKHIAILDPVDRHADLRFYECDTSVEEYFLQLGKTCPVLRYRAVPQNTLNITMLAPTCVTFVKYVTGFNSFALTPYGLYSELLERGAVRIGA